jgi:hypothetical protein
MVSTWWIRDRIKDYVVDPQPSTLVEILDSVVEALDELDRTKADEDEIRRYVDDQ